MAASVTAVHEDMHQQADSERQKKWQDGEKMHPVFESERQPDTGNHDADRQSGWGAQKTRDTPTFERCWFGMFCHFLTSSFTRFRSSELPITDSELAVMAITPIMGCSRPRAATGMAARL